MEDHEIRLYERAGKIASKALYYGMEIVHEGMPVKELCEKIENMIIKLGGKPAFPCNISINQIAAHYTSPPDDTLVIPRDSLVKIDVGVHIEGYIADTAGSITFSREYEPLIIAAKKALENAISLIKSGVSLGRIGSKIEETIKEYGFKPIKNLTGHKIEPWKLHAGKTVPNVSTYTIEHVRKGEVYAIEPFVTNGKGYVVEENRVYIFSYSGGKAKSKAERSLLRTIWREFRTLPFCERWLLRIAPHYMETFLSLRKRNILYEYPVLKEAGNGIVSQWEHTILIAEEGALVITYAE